MKGFGLLLFLLFPLLLFSQLSQPGEPASTRYASSGEISSIIIAPPDLSPTRLQDEEDEKMGLPRQVAVAVPVSINLGKTGTWQYLPDGTRIKRVALECNGALAMSLTFSTYSLPEGVEIYLYDEEQRVTLGAFTSENNRPDLGFSTGLVPGDKAILEINMHPGSAEEPVLDLSEISYLYRDYPSFLDGRGTADHCEVNINCPEGDNWQKQKRGVVRIYVKKNAAYFWCSGSLVNNARKDLTPYLLTADHCAPSVSAGDLAQWVFYFNYEAPGCENPVNNPAEVSLVGATRLANASTAGSDFLLVLLDDEVPETYQPYFNGWSKENIAPPNGVTIHHPNGDIRKISTYNQPPASSQWSGIPGTHWEVYWAETVTNWGVTEGGSSGAPLFDNNGKIIGTLTGGLAACDPGSGGAGTGPDKPDYFGKFSFSWDQNGDDPSVQLKPWLDPDNTGISTLAGMNSTLTAAFESDEQIILVGDEVTFTNLSSGIPVLWEWAFEGGVPDSYSGAQPPVIKYPNGGLFDVSLIVSDGTEQDTLVLRDYIQAVGPVYPNPAIDKVNIYLNADLPALVSAEIFNVAGQKIGSAEYPEHYSRLVSLDVSTLPAGIYMVRLTVKGRYVFAKIFKFEP